MNPDIFSRSIIPSLEIGSYEALWLDENAWFNKIADKFKSSNNDTLLPSEIVHDTSKAAQLYNEVLERIHKAKIDNFGAIFRDTYDYPLKLDDAKCKLQLLYYAGNLNLINSRSVAIVGTRIPSQEGILRTIKLVKALVDKKLTIVSGLAAGIDTCAHKTAIEAGGDTIAVLGTPLDVPYPRENTLLLHEVMNNHLAISQVPFIKYANQNFATKKFYFPERNKTMSAISEATIIVEAGETSGTLVQARAALEQGRKLFILKSCFDKGLTWPDKYLSKGAIKVTSIDDIWKALDI